MADLDDILDAALDEFDADASSTQQQGQQPQQQAADTTATTSGATATNHTAATTAASPPALSPTDASNIDALANDPAAMAAFHAFLKAMGGAEGANDPAAADAMAGMDAELSAIIAQMGKLNAPAASSSSAASTGPASSAAAAASSSSAAAAVSSAALASPSGGAVAALSAPSSSGDSGSSGSSSADPVSDAVRMISEGARSMPAGGAAPGGLDLNDPAMEAMLTKLMAEMGAAAGGAGGAGADGAAPGDLDGMDQMVEKMMGSMLSKEYLYQPMKDIAEKYPAYILEHESTLSAADLSNYRKQQSCFERIVHVFDTQPQASMQIMELMNEMQQYGTPPKELVADFVPPGFDAQAAMPPGMAGLAGLTGAGADGAAGMPPLDDAFMQQLAKDDSCKTQ